jgi:hypothetical protein
VQPKAALTCPTRPIFPIAPQLARLSPRDAHSNASCRCRPVRPGGCVNVCRPDHASCPVLLATSVHVLPKQPTPYRLRSPRHAKETSSPLSTPRSRAPCAAITEHHLLQPTHQADAPRGPKQLPPLVCVSVRQHPPPSPTLKLVPCSAPPSFPFACRTSVYPVDIATVTEPPQK